MRGKVRPARWRLAWPNPRYYACLIRTETKEKKGAAGEPGAGPGTALILPPRPLLRGWILVLVLLAALFFLLGGMLAGGELGTMAAAGLQMLPFVCLAMLAHLGWRRRWARVLSWLGVGLLLTVLALTTLWVVMAVSMDVDPTRPGASFDPAAMPGLGRAALALLVASVVSSVVLDAGVRRLLARHLPFNPNAQVHALALWSVLSVTTLFFVPLAIFDHPPLLRLLQRSPEALTGQKDVLQQVFYPLLWLVPGVLLAAGYGLHRNLHQALHRLGLRGLSVKQAALCVLAGLAMACLVVFSALPLRFLWQWAGLPMTEGAQLERLFADYITPLGVVGLAISAGVSEELVFRGLLQTRLGLLLPNLLFTSLHAWQYHLDGLLVVFFVGLVCGWVRRRLNTVAAMVLHGTYDLGLLLLVLWSR